VAEQAKHPAVHVTTRVRPSAEPTGLLKSKGQYTCCTKKKSTQLLMPITP
jgi:hypothetical protein